MACFLKIVPPHFHGLPICSFQCRSHFSTPFPPSRVSSSSSAPASQLLQVEAASWRQQLHSLQENRFLAIPVIFLQVVQLMSQACCLPLPELLNIKAQLSNATFRFAKSIEINMLHRRIVGLSAS